MTIREATPADRDRLLEMAERFIATTPYAVFGSKRAQLEWILDVVQAHGITFVAEHAGVVVGMIAAIVAPHPWTGIPLVDELAWWVEPEHRDGTFGPRLVQALEQWAVTKGVTSIRMNAPAGTDIGRFYRRRGYVEIETVYLKRL